MTIPAMPGETSADSPQAFAHSSTPPGESLIPLVHILWLTRSSLTRDMHTESRNSVPLRLIVRNECVLSTGNFPHSVDCKKSATDFRRIDPVPIFNFFQMITQSATKFPSLSYIDRQVVAKKDIDTMLLRRPRRGEWMFRTCF
jgi:hypothetical protein